MAIYQKFCPLELENLWLLVLTGWEKRIESTRKAVGKGSSSLPGPPEIRDRTYLKI